MILVTGANGLVGSYLCRYLLMQGKQVRGLKRNSSDFRLIADIKDKIEWAEGDILDILSLEEAMEGIEQVFHCAAFISYSKKDEKKLMSVNVQGTANVVNAALEKNIQKLIYFSSIAAVGRTGKDGEIVNENIPWDRKTINSDYSLSKFLAEREVWRGIAEGLNAVILNPAIIVGAGNWTSGSCRLFSTVHDGFKYYTEGVTGYTDVRDVVKIAFQLSQKETKGERFVICSENLSYHDFLTSIGKALNVKGPTVKAGKFLSGIAWRAELIKSLLTGKAPQVTKQTSRIANKKVYFDHGKIVALLNYEFIPVKRSIDDTAASFTKELETKQFYPLTF